MFCNLIERWRKLLAESKNLKNVFEAMSQDVPPVASTLQIWVLDLMGGSEISAKELRREMQERGCRRSQTAFYECMKRMEKSGFVTSRRVVDADGTAEKLFLLAEEGKQAMAEARKFFERRIWESVGLDEV